MNFYEDVKSWIEPIDETIAVRTGNDELDALVKKYLQKFGNAMGSDMKELRADKYDKIKTLFIELAKEAKELK